MSNKINKQQQDLERYLDLATRSAQLMLWHYFPSVKEAVTFKSSVTVPGLPDEGMRNLPDSLYPYVETESQETLHEFYEKMHQDVQQAECEIWYKATLAHAPLCTRIHCLRNSTPGSEIPEYICVSRDITLEKMVASQYNRVMAGITRDSEQFLSIAFINVTKNTINNIYNANNYALNSYHITDYDKIVKIFARNFADDFARDHYLNSCSRQSLLEAFTKGNDRGLLRFRYKLGSGGVHWLTVNFSMAKNPFTGDIEGIAYIRDIHLEVEREQALRRLTDWDFESIALLDLPGEEFNYLSRNAMALKILPHEKMDYDCEMSFVAEHRVDPAQREDFLKNILLTGLKKNIARQPHFSYSVSMYDDDGKFKRKLFHYSFLDETHNSILLTIMDVTDSYLQHLEETNAVRAMLKREERALQDRNDFFSNISHDMRTPLNGILGFTDLALESKDLNQIHQYLGKIKLSGGLLLDLINDTLILSKLESGKLTPKYEIIDNRLISGRVLIPIQAMAEAKGVTLVQDRSHSPHVLLKADRVNTQKIFINLISNAVKFTPKGGKVEVIMEQLLQPLQDCNYRFIVRDNGIGISKDFLPHIFEPFTQESNPVTIQDHAQGTGLGLAIVKQLVNLLKGHIKVESEQGKGTTFTVLLPMPVVKNVQGEPDWIPGVQDLVSPTAEAVFKKQKDSLRQSLNVNTPAKILLCEDNPLNLEIAATILRKRKYVVDTATNGKLGVEKFKASRPGEYMAVLMDLRMPVMNGYEAAKAIRKLGRTDAGIVPIIALSADAYEEDVLKAKEAGMNAHLSKPIQPEEFFATLAKFK